MNEKYLLNINKVEIAEADSNDIYMMLQIPICGSHPNANGLRFTEEYLEWAVQNQEESGLADMPICVNRDKLESGQYHNLTHEFNGEEFDTDMVGTVVDVWTQRDEEDDELILMSSAKIFKRFPNTVEAMKELHNDGSLAFSMEILASEIEYASGGIRDLHMGKFIGDTLVSQPAYEKSANNKILVAEAYEKDLINIKKEKGGIKVENTLQIAGLSIDLLRSKISQQLEYSQYEMTFSLEDNKVVVRDWEEGKYYIASFSVDGEEVSVDLENKMEGSLVWMEKDAVSPSDLVVANKELTEKVSDLEGEVETLKAEKEVVEEPVKEEPKMSTEIAEEIIGLKGVIDGLKTQLAELEPFKVEAERLQAEKEKAELEAKQLEVSELLSKVVNEKDLTDEHKEMIEKADIQSAKVYVADVYIAQLKEESVDKNDEEDIVVETAEDKQFTVEKKTYFSKAKGGK